LRSAVAALALWLWVPVTHGGGTIFGRLVTASGMAPGGGQAPVVTVTGPAGSRPYEHPHPGGVFHLAGLAPGRYAVYGQWVDAGNSTHLTEYALLDLADGEAREISLRLDGGGTLGFTVVGHPGGTVRLYYAPVGVPSLAASYRPPYSYGTVDLRGGEYDLYARASTLSYPTPTTRVTIVPGQQVDVTLIFQAPPVVALGGEVRDETGATVANATVELDWREEAAAGTQVTGADGRFSFTNVAPGVHRLWAESVGEGVTRLSETAVVDVAAGTEGRADLTVRPAAVLSGHVTVGGSPPNPGDARDVFITREPQDTDYRLRASPDATGLYILPAAPSGQQVVRTRGPAGGWQQQQVAVPAGGVVSGIDFAFPAILDVTVQVTDWQGNPVAGADVALIHPDPAVGSTESEEPAGADGRTLVEWVYADPNYRLRAVGARTAAGLELISAESPGVSVDAAHADLAISLPQPGSVAGTVAATVSDPAEIEVVLVFGSGAVFQQVPHSTRDGLSFAFANLPPGAYVGFVRETAAPYVVSSLARFVLGPGQAVPDLALEIGYSGRISGTVRNADGSPVSGALVTAGAGSFSRTATTGADGAYSITSLPGGSYAVSATIGYVVSPAQTVALAEAGEQHVDVALPRSPGVEILVLQSSGQPAAGIPVRASQNGQSFILTQNTAADGRIAFPFLVPGTCSLTAWHPEGTLYAWTSVDLAGTETRSVELRMPPPGSISGHALDVFGEPLAGAHVKLNWNPDLVCVTGADGAFRFDHLGPDSAYWLFGDHPTAGYQLTWTEVPLAEGENRIGVIVLRTYANPPQMTYSVPANGGTVLATWGYAYVLGVIWAGPAGVSMDPATARAWFDGVPVGPADFSVEAVAPHGTVGLRVVFAPVVPETLLGAHVVEFAAADTLGNAARFALQISGVAVGRITQTTVTPRLFSPNGDGRYDAIEFTAVVEGVAHPAVDAWVYNRSVPMVETDGVWHGTWQETILLSGEYPALVAVTDPDRLDPSGNPLIISSAPVTVVSDIDAPTFEIVTPATTNQAGFVEGRVADASPLASLRLYRPDGRAWVELPAATGAWTAPLDPPLPDGTHTLRIEAEDAVANSAGLDFTVTVDTGLPTIAFVRPLSGLEQPPREEFEATLLDASGVGIDRAHCTVALDGRAVDTSAFTWTGDHWYGDLGVLADGEHTLTVWAVDLAGNGRLGTLSFRTATRPPRLADRTPGPGAVWSSLRLSVDLAVADWSGVGLATAELYLDGTLTDPNVADWDPAAGTYHYDHWTWLRSGEHALRFRVTDNLGQELDETWAFTVRLEPVEGEFAGVVYEVSPSFPFFDDDHDRYLWLQPGPRTGHGPQEFLDGIWGRSFQQGAPTNATTYTWVPHPGGNLPPTFIDTAFGCYRFWPGPADALDELTDPVVWGHFEGAYWVTDRPESTAAHFVQVDPALFPGNSIPVFFRNRLATTATSAALAVTWQGRAFPSGFQTLHTAAAADGSWCSDPLWVPKAAVADGWLWVGMHRHGAWRDTPLTVALSDPVIRVIGPVVDIFTPERNSEVEENGLLNIGAHFRDDSAYGGDYDVDPATVHLEFDGAPVGSTYDAGTRTVRGRVFADHAGSHTVTAVAANRAGVRSETSWQFDYVFYGYLWQRLTLGGAEYRVYIRVDGDTLDELTIRGLPANRLGPGFTPAITGLNIVKRRHDGGRTHDYLVASEALARALIQASYRVAYYRSLGDLAAWDPVQQWEVDWMHVAAEAKTGEFLYTLGQMTAQDLQAMPDELATMNQAMALSLADNNSASEVPETYDEVSGLVLDSVGNTATILDQFEKLEDLKEVRQLAKYKGLQRSLDKLLLLKDTIETVAGAADFLATTGALVDEVWRVIFATYWQLDLIDDFRTDLLRLEPYLDGLDPDVYQAYCELLYFDTGMLYQDIAGIIATAVVNGYAGEIKDLVATAMSGTVAGAVLKGIDLFYTLSDWTGWDNLKATGQHGVYVADVQAVYFQVWEDLVTQLKTSEVAAVEDITAAALATRLYMAASIQLWEDCKGLALGLQGIYDTVPGLDAPHDYNGWAGDWTTEAAELSAALAEVVPEGLPGNRMDVEWLLERVVTQALYGDTATLQIEILSPVRGLLTDPEARHLGTTAEGADLNEVPGATYSGADAHPVRFGLPAPPHGTYRLALRGTGTGSYDVEVTAVGGDGLPLSACSFTGEANPGLVTESAFTLATADVTSEPAPVLGISAPESSLEAGGLRLHWRTSVPSTCRVFHAAVDSGAAPVEVEASSLDLEHEALLGGLAPETPYALWVQARDGAGAQRLSPSRFVCLADLADTTAPAPPAGLQAGYLPDGTGLFVWEGNTEADLAGYRVVAVKPDGSALSPNPVQTDRFFAFDLGQDRAPDLGFSVVAEDRAGNRSPRPAAVLAGRLAEGLAGDMDGDGLPDAWELGSGLNPLASQDAAEDADHDGLSNRREYELGTPVRRADHCLTLLHTGHVADSAALLARFGQSVLLAQPLGATVLPREAALADDELAGFRILVLPGCEAALTPEEVGAIRRFAGAGGSVLVAGPDAAGAAGGDALAGLLAPYGMSIGPPGTGAGEHTPCAHAITEDMGGSVACGSVVATVAGGVPFLLSAAGPTAVAGEHASGGRAVLLGDASLLLETALEPNREELLLNLLGWLSRSASEWHGELQPGWNLVSVPLFPLDPGTTAVLAGLAVPARRAFGWSQARGTTALQCLLPGDAFWVYLGDDGRESAGTAVPWDVRGDPSRRTTVRLRAGWNLVGPLHGGAIPAGLGVLAVWAWDPGANAYEFILPDTPLQPGRGYWVFSTRACDVAW
jgi:hypothetical protein